MLCKSATVPAAVILQLPQGNTCFQQNATDPIHRDGKALKIGKVGRPIIF